MNNKKSDKPTRPAYIIDNSLKKYIGKVTTKERMDAANKRLQSTKLPDEYYESQK